jgi:hypothetical protein
VTHRRRTHAVVFTAVAAVAALALLWPSFLASAQSSDPEAEREGLRRRQADVAAELDVLRASDAEVSQALATLNANLSDQLDRVTAAKQAAADARAAEAAAEQRVVEAQQTVDDLAAKLREMAVGLYIRPPLDDLVTAVVNAQPNDAAQRFALARFRVEDVTVVLDQSKQARTALEAAQRLAVDARLEADQRSQATQASTTSRPPAPSSRPSPTRSPSASNRPWASSASSRARTRR